MLSAILLSLFVLTIHIVSQTAALGNGPPGVDVWCGKAYRPQDSSFFPGGVLSDPTPSAPLLDFRVRPRNNIYTASDTTGSLIVDASLTFIGEAFDDTTPNGNAFDILVLDITDRESDRFLVNAQLIGINTTANEFPFDLKRFAPRLEPYNITAIGSSQDRSRTYVATSQIYRLPDRSDGGSVVKVDSLYGGLLVQDTTSNSTSWKPIFPYSFYVSWDGYLNRSLSQLDAFQALGYNIIHVVPDAALSNEAFPWEDFDQYLQHADELSLYVMYDMRWTYQNTSAVTDQVKNHIFEHPSLLLYYTGDEPDGSTDPLDATTNTYSLLKSMDPYHPVSLCLNCANFYYSDYAAGADIILSDPYPIAVNTSYSTVYDTPCNSSYGCCGCDDCKGSFADVSSRFDTFNHYDDILGWGRKPKWSVPQAFGNETFWSRYPTPDEEVVMNLLSVNHGVKGIVMWDFPTTPELQDVTSRLAKVLTRDDVTEFLLGTDTIGLLPVSGASKVDVSAWIGKSSMLVSVVNQDYTESSGSVIVSLPMAVTSVAETLWGPGGWTLGNGTMSKTGISGLEADMLILTLA